ncbi:outer membrane beta-barrel protein [Algibacter miyuki]|uniref:Outer membrane beta-barrel protein n=1 Tax=Algibacter miyuki TaxID=1306933 RepID=A0ABV5H352_9FLAO|nr:outer membrane beta-barrel protein [Algibacter miyuki]MDN3665376.1 outer membrane beta-barrel protein [Algibacter miyuki]
MKNLFLILVVAIVVPSAAFAQSASGIGIKGGLNYNANGKYVESINDNAQNPDRNVGYHIGLFGKIGDKLFLRPEIVYTKTKSDYEDDTFSMQKLDAPILVGLKILGPVSVFAGPSFQYILDTDFEGITVGDIKDDFSVGLNFGVGLNFKKVGIDLRYERGFTENEGTFIGNNGINGGRLDTRPDQLILSLAIIL